MDKYQTRPYYMFNILYRLGDNGSIAIPSTDLDIVKERHMKLRKLNPKGTQVIMLGGLKNYGEYQPVTTMTFEEAVKFLKKDGRIE